MDLPAELARVHASPAQGGSRGSIRRHMVAGLVVVMLLAGGVGGWAATTQIAGALIAPGSIVVDSHVKKVQHPTGGVVGKLFVQDGDRVKAGQVLVQLDDTVTRANLAIVTKGLDELAARKARLEAERDGAETVTFPPELLAAHERSRPSPTPSPTSASCSNCAARRALGQKAQLQQRIAQLKEEIRGLERAAGRQGASEIELIHKELAGVRDL